ncbi:MAG: hypothetical protein M3460_16985 [Actinomycetota bacterium]|nr:hypothetical protein [Actinomycetota bacterium]
MSIRYFVDPVDGNDNNDGRAPERPLKTIAQAGNLANPGDTVCLHAGRIYRGTTVFPASLAGTRKAPIVVEPYAGSHVVLDGRLPQPAFDTAPDKPEGNGLWEPVVGGHCQEWRTKELLNADLPPGSKPEGQGVRYGAFADTRHRLITYHRLDDLRADNESYYEVPLADPRPGSGPLVDRPEHKMPWTYLGPGFAWVFEDPTDPANPRGRVHVRLSHTGLRAPGMRDYAGYTNPNKVALVFSRENSMAAVVTASHVVLRNLVIANGGLTTLTVEWPGHGVVFDHCAVYGGRYGVRVSDKAHGVRFSHCTFDGALAPWTGRGDVKSEYRYRDQHGNVVTNETGAKTHDILVIAHGSDDTEFAHCTFRRAHDALQLGGIDVSVHDCLFEDINDEVVQFHASRNARVFRNLIRQALHPFSFSLEQAGGPIYIYRNVVDQRIPTRGLRVLPPDAPAPRIWRYGASFKEGHPMPEVYVYHNTFVGSHPDDKASALSLLFYGGHLSADAPRVHLNNLIVGLKINLPYSWAMPTSTRPPITRRSDGNLWWMPHRTDASLFYFQRPGEPKPVAVKTLAELRALDPLWEAKSRYGDPGLANLDDEVFEHGRYFGEPYPDNDFRPAPGSLAIRAGVDLPERLPDTSRPAGGILPDIGALPSEAPPLRVGADDEVTLPAAGVPVARGPGGRG